MTLIHNIQDYKYQVASSPYHNGVSACLTSIISTDHIMVMHIHGAVRARLMIVQRRAYVRVGVHGLRAAKRSLACVDRRLISSVNPSCHNINAMLLPRVLLMSSVLCISGNSVFTPKASACALVSQVYIILPIANQYFCTANIESSAILQKWVPYSQRYLVLVLVGLALWLVSGIALNKYRCE